MEEIFIDCLLNKADKVLEYLKFGDVNITSETGESLLHYAARGNSMEVANILLANFINPNIKDHNGETPIFMVVRSAKIGFIKLLLRNHADLNIINNKGENLLFRAIIKGNKEVIDLILLNSDFNFHLKNIQGESILNYALEAYNFPLFKKLALKYPELLKNKTYDDIDILKTAIKKENFEAVEFLIDNYDFNFYSLDKELNNTLFYAAKYGNYDIIKKLLSKKPIIEGVNLYQKDIFEVAETNEHEIKDLFITYAHSYDYLQYKKNYFYHTLVIERNYDLLSNAKNLDLKKRDTLGISLEAYLYLVNDQELLKLFNLKGKSQSY